MLFDGAPPTQEPFQAPMEPLTVVVPVTEDKYAQLLPSKFVAMQVVLKSQIASQSSKPNAPVSCLFCWLSSKVPWNAIPHVTV